MSSELLTQLTDLLHTTYDVRVLRVELEKVKDSVYGNGNKSLETTLKEQVRTEVARILQPALVTNPEKVLDELVDEMKELPLLRLSIAFEPTQSSVEMITRWLQTNTGKHWILDLTVDPKVGAGAVIEAGGLYRDFSLNEKLDQVVQRVTQQLIGRK